MSTKYPQSPQKRNFVDFVDVCGHTYNFYFIDIYIFSKVSTKSTRFFGRQNFWSRSARVMV